MEYFEMILAILLLMLGIPLGLSALLYWAIKKLNVDKKWRLLASAPIIIALYIVYDAFYPSTAFYQEEFKAITHIDLPENAEIRHKVASYPDNHGDYQVAFLIELEQDAYASLESHIIKQGFLLDSFMVYHNQLGEIESKLDGRKYLRKYGKEEESHTCFVGFLSDQKSVILSKGSF